MKYVFQLDRDSRKTVPSDGTSSVLFTFVWPCFAYLKCRLTSRLLRFFWNRHFIPQGACKMASKMMLKTVSFSRWILNPYTISFFNCIWILEKPYLPTALQALFLHYFDHSLHVWSVAWRYGCYGFSEIGHSYHFGLVKLLPKMVFKNAPFLRWILRPYKMRFFN